MVQILQRPGRRYDRPVAPSSIAIVAPPPAARTDGTPAPRTDMLRSEISQLQNHLYILTSQVLTPKTKEDLKTKRLEMKLKCEELIITEPSFARHCGIDQVLWKSVFYNCVEMYRAMIKIEEGGASAAGGPSCASSPSCANGDEYKACLLQLLNEAASFYEDLLRKIEHQNSFHLEEYLDTDHPKPELSNSMKLLLVLCQSVMLCLGDIARYADDFPSAKSWYQKAQILMPKNSQPYTKLAVLAAHNQGRWLDAVYYSIRSLTTTSPNLAATEQLIQLFEMFRRKAEFEKQKAEPVQSKPSSSHRRRGPDPLRQEVWITPDGNKESDVQDTPSVIFKRLLLNFLFAQGKLYTKTGLENFVELCHNVLEDLEKTLASSSVDADRLMKVMVINVFQIYNTGPHDNERRPANQPRNLRQDYAIVLLLDMFALVVKRFIRVYRQHLTSPIYPAQLFNPELRILYPCLKIAMDWLTNFNKIWNPPPAEDLGSSHDIWACLSELASMMHKVDISSLQLLTKPTEGYCPVTLPEDALVDGFVPLMAVPRAPIYADESCGYDMAHMRDCYRVYKLKQFSEVLCGIDPAVLKFQVEKLYYFSVVETYIYSDGSHSTGTTQSEEESDDGVIIEDSYIRTTEDADDGQPEVPESSVQQLRARKALLQKNLDHIQQERSSHEAVLEGEKPRGLIIEIRPLYLVPDTNCFIDNFPDLQCILKSGRYTLVVPLVVINELDGLTKDPTRRQRMLTARQVIQFLEQQFEVRDSHLKAMTSKGTIMETISFRSENTDDKKGNNDDVILSCCLFYCQDKAKDFMPASRDEPIRLQRQVVLLTDDRNLCVKAHTRNVPVRDVANFMDYAGF